MNSSPLQGYFTFIQETPDTLRFTRTAQQRGKLGLTLGAVAIVLFSTAFYSFTRSQRDMGGLVFFLLTGIVSAGAGLFFCFSWPEIEFNRLEHRIIKRRFIWNRGSTPEVLFFEQLEQVSIIRTWGEISDAYHIRLVRRSGGVWASIPGYMIENQARDVRRKILALMQQTD
jgi:hypothetical protein